MNLQDTKKKIDRYFNNISAKEIVKDFKKLGYEFVELPKKKESRISF